MLYNVEVKKSEVYFGLARVASDAITVAFALVLSWWLRTQNMDLIPGIQLLEPAQTLPSLEYYLSSFLPAATILFLFVVAALKLYIIRITLGYFREQARIAISAIVWVGLIMTWYFFVEKQLFYSRILLLHSMFFAAVLVSLGRTVLTLIQRSLLKKGMGVRNVLSIGEHELPLQVKQFLTQDPRYSYLAHCPSVGGQHAGALQGYIDKEGVDLILQTDPSSSDETNALIDFCRSHHISYAFLPPVLIDVPHLLRTYRFGSVPILRLQPTPLDGWGTVLKRMMDMFLATIFLILLSPIFVLIAIGIKIDSKGSVFYKSRRIGRKKFFLLVMKFRSMVQNADELKEDLEDQSHRTDGPLFKIKDDPRVTRIGKFLRRYSLDELPQLFSVLKGEMSLVGPRPHLPEEVDKYTDFQKRVFAVKPGITGLSQISGRSDLPFDEEVRLDLQYIEEWSPWLDLWIIWRTFWVVLKGEGAD